ncbi:23S rRNA (uracil(1939)-C(5))-methyltransferase RlmD [Flavisolibacter ginsenosidimutans]|uniref:23S rRNA (Uracil(1939)-C(5))-methyltransferase RlmD n=1 Tax=Flavisolibacter ginsenosidimutans TaxID=661481 RepID=A0A5B8ULS1_9BACT|nr:23S rRNA (uracil(1939)-C(5))-methyltransferase RlmD [Flavisolibacter ginsenosidimutans]QEC57000.1 23S rRNA (uracil(1939)-C(5))-methyltransferase RlmD [Flavisolibacter ginsenosidimutans]
MNIGQQPTDHDTEAVVKTAALSFLKEAAVDSAVFLPPVKKKKKDTVLEQVLVEAYAAEGKSLARRDGKVIFIEGAVPGDVVDLRLGKNKKDWAEGQPLKFHVYSKERAEPFCRHFGVCGGCQWQMLPYEKQLQYKHQQVKDNLSRIGKIQLPEFLPIVGAQEDKFYRNKLEFTFSTKEFTPQPPKEGLPAAQPSLVENTANGAKSSESEVSALAPPTASGAGGVAGALGFHAKGFFDKVVQIEKCWLQAEPQNALRNALRDFAFQKGYSFYDFREHKGLLRNLQFRICTTGEVMVNVVFGEDDKKGRQEILSFVEKNFPDITTLLYTVNLKWNDSLYDQEPVVYKGKGFVEEKLEDFRFKIGPKSFFQTNTKQGEKLYQITRHFAELNGSQTLYDLYCGTGSIGIFCSRGAKKIIGVEAIDAAVQDAKENALLNGIGHAQFFTGDVIEVCNDDFFAAHGKPDVIITDPPRAGMHTKLVEKILDMEAPTVVYVSCNPATQARDLSLLDAKYAVTKVQPVDMFPHTHHIENVVQLKRR